MVDHATFAYKIKNVCRNLKFTVEFAQFCDSYTEENKRA